MDNTLCAMWMLSRAPTWSKVLFKLLRAYESPLEVYEHSQTGFDKEYFSAEESRLFSDGKLDKAKEIISYCKKNGIKIISFADNDYPTYLANIPTPPVALFVKGEIPDTFSNPSITIVGTRDCTETGKRIAAKMAYNLSSLGFTVVSGMARGIDTYAHKGCLMANASPTIAVLAGPVEDVYPRENKDLYDLICKNGAVISELPPGAKMSKWAFQQRNRILSGLTFSTVVVESGVKGGSLITASHALDQNRTLFAVPGMPGAPSSEGANRLIKQGAILCGDINDILNEYKCVFKDRIGTVDIADMKKNAVAAKAQKKKEQTKKILTLTNEEQRLYDALDNKDLTADGICNVTGLQFFEIISGLQSLELKDLIEQLPGGIYKQKHI